MSQESEIKAGMRLFARGGRFTVVGPTKDNPGHFDVKKKIRGSDYVLSLPEAEVREGLTEFSLGDTVAQLSSQNSPNSEMRRMRFFPKRTEKSDDD